MAGYTIKGITDTVDACEHCGTRIKRAVALMPLDADGNEWGEVTYFGTQCAGRALGKKTAWVTNTARGAQVKRDDAVWWAREVLAAYEPVEFAPVREKFRVFALERNNQLRAGETVTTAVAGLLASARAILAAGH
jgi:hypothetical protein